MKFKINDTAIIKGNRRGVIEDVLTDERIRYPYFVRLDNGDSEWCEESDFVIQ